MQVCRSCGSPGKLQTFGVPHGGGGGGELHFHGAKFSISSRLVGDLIHSITCLMPSIHTSPRESMSCRNSFMAGNEQP